MDLGFVAGAGLGLRRRPALCSSTSSRRSSIRMGVIDSLFILSNALSVPSWGGMLFAPKSKWTKTIVVTPLGIIPIALLYVYGILTTNAPALSELALKVHYDFLSFQFIDKAIGLGGGTTLALWCHIIVQDTIAGRWIMMDGEENGIPYKHSLVFCGLLGPLGPVVHMITKAIVMGNRKEEEA